MKKFFIIISLSIVTILSGVISSKYHNSLSTYALYSENVEVLTQGDSFDDLLKMQCLSGGFNYNMASIVSNSGFQTVTCEIKGEISLLGVTVKGEYKKGNQYGIPWATYSCSASNGNCCKKQGLYSGDTKLA